MSRDSIVFLDGTRWAWYRPKCMQCMKKVDRIVSYEVTDNGDWNWAFECHGEVARVRISKKIYDYAHKIAVTKVFLSVFLSLFIFVHQGVAEGLNIVHVGGYLSLTDEEVTDTYERATYYFKQYGLTFRLKRYSYETNPCAHLHSPLLYVAAKELNCLKEDAISKGYVRFRLLTYYMLPPYITVEEAYGPQTAWIAGLAESICGHVSMGNATRERYYNGEFNGESRIDHSATVLAHEVSHLLCATHQSSKPNLMHPAANNFTTEYRGRLPVLRITKRQVKRRLVQLRRSSKFRRDA